MTQAGMQAALAQGAASGAREPSMEEILASIRRIIEDSDHTRRANEASADALDAPLDGGFDYVAGDVGPRHAVATPLRHSANDELPELNAFRAELSAGNAEPAARELPRFDATPLTPSPALVREPVADVQPSPAASSHLRRVSLDEMPKADAFVVPMVEAPAVAVRPAVAAEQPARPRDVTEPAQVSPARIEQPVLQPRAEPVVETEEAPRASLISEVAGRQVAAAFGELSDVFAASRRRSFDEIAEEMMRPMLQDWLDNNLPLLVEKLVREEIERVARGGQRQ